MNYHVTDEDEDMRVPERLSDKIMRSNAKRKDTGDKVDSTTFTPVFNNVDEEKALLLRSSTQKKWKEPTTASEITRNLQSALRLNEGTNANAESTAGMLGVQRETLQRSIGAVNETNDNLRLGKRVIRDMKLAIWKERIVKGGIILFLVSIIIFIIYTKWIKKRAK
eukprot:Tbor_TRINITY_DN2378_c0_g1::TRINITY_DN2378_c0_g1_i1::g.189::m.189